MRTAIAVTRNLVGEAQDDDKFRHDRRRHDEPGERREQYAAHAAGRCRIDHAEIGRRQIFGEGDAAGTFQKFAQKPFSTMRAWRSKRLGQMDRLGNFHAMKRNIGRGVLRGKGLRAWANEKTFHRRRRGPMRVIPRTSGEQGSGFLARF